MTDISRIEALSPMQQEELLRRLEAKGGSRRPATVSTPSGMLSFAEERLWFLQQVAPDATAYNVAVAADLDGVISVDALKSALERVVARHEALRTRFVAEAGRPRRIVSPEPRFELEIRELTASPGTLQEARDLVRATAWRPFQLDEGPLLRALIVRVGPQRHVLALVTHHIVSDGWSLRLLARDLWAYYRESAYGIQPRLPAVTRQYAEYGDEQRASWSRPRAESIEYWKRELSLATRLRFGGHAPSRAVTAPRAAIYPFTLDVDLVTALAPLARAEGATTFQIMAAAWSVVLGRYAAGEDFFIGFPSANRPTEELEHVIGLFANTLVLRVSPSLRRSSRSLLRHLKQRAMSALDHELPFSTFVREAKLGGSDALTPLVQAMCVVDEGPAQELDLETFRVRPFVVETQHPKFDLSLIVTREPRIIRSAFEFDSSIFTADEIGLMSRDLVAVLSAMAATPDAPLEAVLSSGRRGAVASATPQPELPCELVHELFARLAADRPGAQAVRSTDATLSYGELLERVERVALFVRDAIVEPGMCVGVCLPRSADAVVAILGILRAGAAYVPLAPSQPATRLRRTAQDAGCAFVFVAPNQTLDGVRTTTVAAALTAGASSAVAKATIVDPEQLAYVLYTSGTTGEPKGVMISHRNLSASTAARIAEYGEPVSRFLWLSPLVFDSSVAGLFWTLCAGGTLVIPEERDLADPTRLRRIVADEGATHTLCLPSLYAAILRGAHSEALRSLHVVIVAGEPCPAELPAAHARVVPDAVLYNEYGPTEGTVWSTIHRCARDEGSRVPIGRPIRGTYVRILDRQGRPVPPGGVGELCLGGAGVAAGYLGHADLTADRFIPDPLGANGRLYRTGDLTSERPDGLLDFHGRVDRQVKVRGVRVDPGEIEAHLLGHPGVRGAAVVGRAIAGQMALVAYVARNGVAIDGPALRAHLRERLPDAFVPARYCILDDLPRTATGKIDVQALPEPSLERGAVRAPSSDTERTIADAWAAVLGTSEIDVDDNFFDVGGHSLLLMSVHATLVARFAGLAIVDLLEHPTIAQLAAFLDRGAVRHDADERSSRVERLRAGAAARRDARVARRLADL